jgi:hypothetical protein
MSKNVCSVSMTGGLGNQLFKFANAIRIATERDLNLVFDTTFYDYVSRVKNYATPRLFELHDFPNLRNIETSSCSMQFAHRAFFKIMRASPEFFRRFFGVYIEGDNFSRFRRINYIEGSFEDLVYFPAFGYLGNLLKFPQIKSQWLEERLQEINEKRPLSIHVRLTDFLKHPDLYDVLDLSYYTNAVTLFKSKYPGHPLWLFSDDPILALEFLGSDFIFDRIVGPNDGGSSFENLELLSSSFGICTANSTFSWWAAFLGTLNNSCKYVVMPRKFNSLNSDSPEIKLKVEGWNLF